VDLERAGKGARATGASQGIGEGVGKAFAAEGVNVRLAARNGANLELI
jgi:short-subunit dehydrogenase